MISTSVSKTCDFLKKGTANSHEEGLNEALREKKIKACGQVGKDTTWKASDEGTF